MQILRFKFGISQKISDRQPNGLILHHTFIIQMSCRNASPSWKIQRNFHVTSPRDYIDISISTNNKIHNPYAASATLHMLPLILLALYLFFFFNLIHRKGSLIRIANQTNNSSDNKKTSLLIKNHNPVIIVLPVC